MSKKQVVVLWIIAAVLVVVLVGMRARLTESPEAVTKFSRGDQLVPALDTSEISKVVVSGAGNSTTLVRGEDTWAVSERQGFPADQARLSRAVESLLTLEAVQAYEAGPKYDARFGMDDEAGAAEDHGVHITFLDEAGQELLDVAIGKESSAPADPNPMSMMTMPQTGRYLRVSSDPDSVYVVTESLRDFTGDPAAWLDKDFIKLARIKSITLRAPGDQDFEPWTVTRASATDSFTLEGLGDNEEMQTNAVSPLNNLFSNLRFEDVVPSEEIESHGNKEESRQAIITTFEGFTYTFTLTPKKAAEDLGEDDFNPSAENYFLTVAVTATLPGEREKKPEESEEEAKAADEQFAAEKERLQDKLAREQQFQGRAFEVTNWSLNALLKSRSDLAQPKAAEATAEPPAGATAVSPPVQIPMAPQPDESGEGE